MPPVIAPVPPSAHMTTALWDTTADPFDLLDYKFPIRGMDSVQSQTRKSKLYLLACAKRVPEALPWVLRTLIAVGGELIEAPAKYGDTYRQDVRALAEEMANTADPADALAGAERKLAKLNHFPPADGRDPVPPAKDWIGLAHLAAGTHAKLTPHYKYIPAARHSVELLREIFEPCGGGRISFSPDWRTTPVLDLAEQMYDENEFSRMPILSDALLDAGCGLDSIVKHCRGAGEHVRGCWVLDMILRKPS